MNDEGYDCHDGMVIKTEGCVRNVYGECEWTKGDEESEPLHIVTSLILGLLLCTS